MPKQFVNVIRRSYIERIPVDDILYIERDGRKVRVTTTVGTHEFYSKICEVKEGLDARFYSCLECCIINFDRVRCMKNQEIKFDNGQTYRLGRDNFIRTKQRYCAYIKGII